MPTTRRRTRRPSQNEPWLREYYLHGYTGIGKRALLFGASESFKAWPWEEAKKELLPEWIREHPCSRPYEWWEVEAPEPRRRLGGTGQPTEFEQENLRLDHGVPHKNTWWEGVNPADPPTFESQAAYLQRHGLLIKAENAWLKDHPEALKPKEIEYLQQDLTGQEPS